MNSEERWTLRAVRKWRGLLSADVTGSISKGWGFTRWLFFPFSIGEYRVDFFRDG
jgi:hypothetical protein